MAKDERTVESGFCPIFGYVERCSRVKQVQSELDKLKEAIRYAIGGIDALMPNWDGMTAKDMRAIKKTLEQALKENE